MKILVPIHSSKDVSKLAKAGANEMYCGYLPKEWIDRYNNPKIVREEKSVPCCLNNRNALKSNLLSIEALKECIQECKKNGVELYLVLNAKYYPELAYSDLKKYLEQLRQISVEHLIVSDLGMINYLNINFPEFRISVSCLSQVTNDSSIYFFKSISNVERIVFPRHLQIEEMCAMVEKHTDIEFEFFGLSNKCMYDDGFCRGIHDFYPICKDNWDYNLYRGNQEMTLSQQKNLCNKADEFTHWVRGYDNDRSVEYPWKGVACSMCALRNLFVYDNVTLKLAGRGYNIDERLAQVSLCKKIYDAARDEKKLDELQQMVQQFFGMPFFCGGLNCIMKGTVWK